MTTAIAALAAFIIGATLGTIITYAITTRHTSRPSRLRPL